MEVNTKLLINILACIAFSSIPADACWSRSPPPEKTWINGDYEVGEIDVAIVHVDDDGATFQQLKFLDSEYSAMQPMSWLGGENNTVEITLNGETATAQVSKDSKTITGGPGALATSSLNWITPEEADIIRNREKEPVSAPNVPYPLRPGKVGKIAFLSGPPGSGKSTISGIIAKKEKWIYYEGDGFFLGFNPYVFPNESQVEARSDKPALIGPGMAERGGALVQFLINQHQLGLNQTNNRRPTDHYYNLMAEDIKTERNRVGGDWIVAFAIDKRLDRDIFRKVLGEDLIFVVLDISLDLVKERLKGRGKGEDELANDHWKYEPASEDEPNTIGFEIIKSRSKEENAQAVLDLINQEIQSNME